MPAASPNGQFPVTIHRRRRPAEDQAPSPIQPKDLLAKFGGAAEKVLAAAKDRQRTFQGKPE
jgi:hypothetical protein